MEREFKWRADAALQQAALDRLTPHAAAPLRTLTMDARYYDSPDGALRARKIGLRLRLENGRAVCCMKLRTAPAAGLHEHEEYEADADTLTDGLAALPAVGAPADLCHSLANGPLVEIAHVCFTRRALTVTADGCTAELALDTGTLGREGRTQPLCEIELEYKSGDKDAFLALGRLLSDALGLVPEPLSKLARASAC